MSKERIALALIAAGGAAYAATYWPSTVESTTPSHKPHQLVIPIVSRNQIDLGQGPVALVPTPYPTRVPVRVPLDLEHHFKYAYYDISGQTGEELISGMYYRGPSTEDPNVRTYAYSSYYISWNYKPTINGQRCELRNLKVAVENTMHFPSWIQNGTENPSLVRQWRTFTDALKYHEEGHVHISTQGAVQVYNELQQVASQTNCNDLSTTANQAGYRVLATVKAQHEQYDQETKYGKTQGVDANRLRQ